MNPIAVVVPHFDDPVRLRRALDAMRARAARPDVRWIVAHGGGAEPRLPPEITVVQATGGIASALNAARALVPGHDIARVHADVLIETEAWIDRLVAAAYAEPTPTIVGGTILRPDGRVQSAGRRIVSGAGVLPRHADLRAFEPDRPSASPERTRVDAVAGAIAFYPCVVLDAVGGFDERYGAAGLEDDDVCIAARHAGFEVVAVSDVRGVRDAPAVSPSTRLWVEDPDGLAARLPQLRRIVDEAAYETWEEKWGWNPGRPDLSEIRRVHGETGITWRIGSPMRFRPATWPPSVDLVLVTWNNRAKLDACLDSIAALRYPNLTLHVVDNASTDDTGERLAAIERAFPHPVVVHRLPLNTGVAIGLDWAIAVGRGELVARLDDDIVLPADALTRLVDHFRHRPYAGLVGAKIINDSLDRTIQCGAFRVHPGTYACEDEPDVGQADGLARTVHVRGCFNLYRRDAIDACGPLDLRYSPSQGDDPDHHLALGLAGWEILYDGRVAIRHALTAGAARSFASIANAQGNLTKMIGKWGEDLWRVLDTSLDFSREGRWLDREERVSDEGIAPSAFPSAAGPAAAALAARFDELTKVRTLRRRLSDPAGPLAGYWDDVVATADARRDAGEPTVAAQILGTVLDLAPGRVDAPARLAQILESLGRRDHAERLRSWAGGETPSRAIDPLDVPSTIRGPTAFRFVLPGRPRRDASGTGRARAFRAALEAAGHRVDVTRSLDPEIGEHEVVVLFGLEEPERALEALRSVRRRAPHAPIALVLGGDDVPGDDRDGWTHAVLPMVDRIVALDESAVRRALIPYGFTDSLVVAPPFVSPEFGAGDGETFARRVGVRDFALVLDPIRSDRRIEPVVEAARALGLPLVVAGAAEDGALRYRLRRAGGEFLTLLGPLDGAERAAALAAARFFVHPAAGGAASFARAEAAAAGCALVFAPEDRGLDPNGAVVAHAGEASAMGYAQAIQTAAERLGRDPRSRPERAAIARLGTEPDRALRALTELRPIANRATPGAPARLVRGAGPEA